MTARKHHPTFRTGLDVDDRRLSSDRHRFRDRADAHVALIVVTPAPSSRRLALDGRETRKSEGDRIGAWCQLGDPHWPVLSVTAVRTFSMMNAPASTVTPCGLQTSPHNASQCRLSTQTPGGSPWGKQKNDPSQ
jgi:hypothetical protein